MKDQDGVEEEEEERKRMDEVSPDEARLALVPTKSHSPPPLAVNGVSTSPLHSAIQENPERWLPIGLFIIKTVLLILPCSPYLCSPRIFWPLFGLAVLDFWG
jgi:hypothetical protein